MSVGAIEFGQLIREARLRRGWQQQEVADRIGVDRGYVSTIENGKRNWPQQYIRPLAETLGLDEVDMAIAAGLISPRSDRPSQPVDDVNVVISKSVQHWTPRQRELLWRYIEAVDQALEAPDEPERTESAS